jgi:hypothetical protein
VRAASCTLGTCAECLAAGYDTSGVYALTHGDGVTRDAWCDMEEDGGGWMLMYSYNHVGGENDPLVGGSLPSSITSGYSHMHLEDLGYADFSRIESVRPAPLPIWKRLAPPPVGGACNLKRSLSSLSVLRES